MKRIFILIILIVVTNLHSQNRFSISALGGLNYIPMRDYAQYLNSFTNSDYDKVGFSGTLKLQYNVESRHHVFIESEFISTNASFFGGWGGINWTFEAIPISIGYEYFIKSEDLSWTPYIGLGISYVLTTTEDKYMMDDGSNVERKSGNTFGFETKFGIEKILLEKLILVGELKYRYIGDIKLYKYSNAVETNLSGICFLLGVKLNVL